MNDKKELEEYRNFVKVQEEIKQNILELYDNEKIENTLLRMAINNAIPELQN